MRSKKAIYNIISNFVLQLITIAYGFIVPKIIISCFGSNINGLVSSITQFLAYIALLESGFGPVIKSVLYKPIANKDNRTIISILRTSEKFFRTIALVFLLYIFVLCFIYPVFISKDYSWLFTVSLIVIIGISTFAEYFFGMTYKLFLQAKQKSYIVSIIQIATYVLSIICVVVLAKFEVSIHIIKLATGIVFVLRPLLQNYYVKRKYHINFKDYTDKYELKQKWDGLAQHIAAVIHSNTDITILTVFVNLAEVSVYSVYYFVIKGIKSIIQSIGIDSSFGDMIAKKEINNLNQKFSMYEVMFFTIATIIFTSAILLITPFVSVYTKGITDVNYVRYTFGYLLVVSEYIWVIRLPYIGLTYSAGHFKETRVGAWVECFSNIVVSIILVWKYGIIGVTIGTIVAMTIRTIEFIYHANKYILARDIWESIKKIIVVVVETSIIIFICGLLPKVENISYANWIINAIIVVLVASVVTVSFNFVCFKCEIRELLYMLKKTLKRKK